MTIGQKIREMRVLRGLTQDQVAEKLNMNRANFSHYERDTAIPPSDVLGRIADILNTSTDYLLGRSERDLGDEAIREFKEKFMTLSLEEAKIVAATVRAMVETMKRDMGSE